VNTTNLVGVRVTDDGLPPLSDARSFLITVVSRPIIAGIVVNNGQVLVAWNSLTGQVYRLEYTTNLTAGNWSTTSPDLTATSAVTTQTNALTLAPWQFYRVRVLP
jgi:HAMP domain-containing protein